MNLIGLFYNDLNELNYKELDSELYYYWVELGSI